MSSHKRQHYLPAFYLKDFRKVKSDRSMIYRFPKIGNNSRWEAVNIYDATTEDYIYNKHSLTFDENSPEFFDDSFPLKSELTFSEIEREISVMRSENSSRYFYYLYSLLQYKDPETLYNMYQKFLPNGASIADTQTNLNQHFHQIIELGKEEIEKRFESVSELKLSTESKGFIVSDRPVFQSLVRLQDSQSIFSFYH